ncbi:S41 family peptidase [Psychrobacillus psychrodurans]|uniref:S41 family peptidase n=1 Tax=Psychrobacillus psychrodurans TaxID=126157 RepID=A0A9X3L6V2_9BACI|nr:S41 family peptidase [Psychrobacillus psychrodurans]MCZ8532477.1 S41 family peptidase [Psychrobacillus psychrodurans]
MDDQKQNNEEDITEVKVASKYIKMKPFVFLLSIFALIVVTATITIIVLTWGDDKVVNINTANQAERSEFSKLYLAYDKLEEEYYKEVDEEAVINGAINGMIDALEDPYSDYMNRDEASQFNENISSSFQGIGAEIQERDGYINIVSPIKNSPAEKAGLMPNDKVLAVDGKDIKGYSASEAVLLIRGSKGTEVTLSIQRGTSAQMEVTIVRDDIPIETVYAEMLDDQVAHIIISSFSTNTYDELLTAIDSMEKEGMKALVLDVRQNPGGLLSSAIDISNLFVEEGKNLLQIEIQGDKEVTVATPGSRVKVPVTLIIDEGSASASEILAGALSESANVPLVGLNSFGKGTVQTVNDLPDGSNIKITTAKWLTPDGNWIHDVGILPDHVVEYPSYAMLPPLDTAITLKKNQSSEAVQTAEEMLKAVGYDVGVVDGNFDEQMNTAVKKFQSDNKLAVSGDIDGETSFLLMDLLRAKILEEDPQLIKAQEIVTDLLNK